MTEAGRIWTIGHSNRSLADFLALLQAHGIRALADVRRFPGSRRHPHFSGEFLESELKRIGIDYAHFPALGGRRAAAKDSPNTAWRLAAFRGYADYMAAPEFQQAVARLCQIAGGAPTAYMCAEALWWQCHRALISDLLKSRGWEVLHILDLKKIEPHPYTRAARLVGGELSYKLGEGSPANAKVLELELPLSP